MEPGLRVVESAPQTVVAPIDAAIWDSTAFEERRRRMLSRTQLQVVDDQASFRLESDLNCRLAALREQLASREPRIDPLNLSPTERRWLESLPAAELQAWEQSLRLAQQRMLRQGVMASVADHELVEAANLQLNAKKAIGRRLGARLVAGSLQGQTNLRATRSSARPASCS